MLFILWTWEDAIEMNTNKTPLSKICTVSVENTGYLIITEIDSNICLRW